MAAVLFGKRGGQLSLGEFELGLDLTALCGIHYGPHLCAQLFNLDFEGIGHRRLLDVCERRRARSWRRAGVKDRGTRPPAAARGGAEFLVRPAGAGLKFGGTARP